MTTYTTIADSAVDPNAPLTSELLTALRDNPLAIQEGTAGAPKIKDKVVSGSGTTTVSGLDEYGGLFIRGAGYEKSLSSGVGVGLGVQYSTDNGSTYSSSQSLAGASAGGGSGGVVILQVEVFIDFATGQYVGYQVSAEGEASVNAGSASQVSGTITGLSSSVTDMKFIGLDGIIINPQGGAAA